MENVKYITLFDRQYPADKQAEGIAIHDAVVNGECDKCGFLAQCQTDEAFIPPVFAWCAQRKHEILEDWRRSDNG